MAVQEIGIAEACGYVIRLVSAALALGLFLLPGCKPKLADGNAGKPPDAWIIYPTYRTVEEFEDFTGKTEPEKYVVVKPRATGHLKKVNFKDGDMVKAGDVLFEIDPREYRAALEVAKASLLKAEVTMKQLESDHRRGIELMRTDAMAREVFEQVASNLNVARAMVSVAEANKQTAEYNLAWCNVTAEISGRISRRAREADAGNVVEKEKTVLTDIVKLDPMYATFDIDERTVLRLQKNVKAGKLLLSQDQLLKFKIGLADESGYSIDGTIDFVDNKIDTGTGTLRVRGTFDNTMFVPGTWPWERPKNYRLQPGLFIRVRLPVGEPHDALLIPEKAIFTDQDQKCIYVVNDKHEVKRRGVKLGTLQEDKMRVISEGLSAGEMVIVTGLQRVRPKNPDGSPFVVEPKEFKEPSGK